MSTPAELTLEAANRLEEAQRTRRPTAPVRDILGSTDVAAGYRVQHEVNQRRVHRGATAVGRKIGLTSPAVQQQLGVDQPDFGVLFSDMGYADGAELSSDTLLQPRIEAEVAFLLAEDLTGHLDLAKVRRSVDCAVAALEIVDSRIANWDLSIVDTVADNGSSALYVLGSTSLTLDRFEPRDVNMSMTVDGGVASSGNGAACLGDPLAALLWLARTAQEYGNPLRAGEVILSGALGPMVPVEASSRVRAEIGPLGMVSVNFANREQS